MGQALEVPGGEDSPDWEALYLYRGADVSPARPVFTGDVFFGVEVQGVGARRSADVLMVQHPCALRTDGIHLTDTIMVVEVHPYRLLAPREWRGNYRLMPLPALVVDPEDAHRAARFTSPLLAAPSDLEIRKRVACMSPTGVNLLLQRWVYHNSRAAVPTSTYDEATSGPYEEADAVEEWCDIRAASGLGIDEATAEANAWLSDDGGSGVARRSLLENRQYRSPMRRAMRKYARDLPRRP